MAKIFPPELAIDSMKDSGYKDAAYAIAELIDNSIQAGETSDRMINVELICIEEKSFLNERSSSKIEKIAVFDNAAGMPLDVLNQALAFGQGTRKGALTGMGKFGMGLPNASISQADRVEVWTWQKGKIFFTYLDIDEIKDQRYDEVPEPVVMDKLPEEWLSKINSDISDTGTLIVWDKLKRLKWKRHRAFFSNTEFIVGRIYRYFINDKKCNIRMAAFTNGDNIYDQNVRPNDPLYLLSNTNSPKPFNKKPAFEIFSDSYTIDIRYKGNTHKVSIKTSVSKQNFRKKAAEEGKNAGNTDIGKHCNKNQGVSVVRSGRELELNNSFDITYDPTERWWGVEVSFNPDLDEVFGVTNNKQHATAFKKLGFDELAEDEGIKRGEIESFLQNENDIRLPIVHISNEIISQLSAMRKLIESQTKGVKKKKQAEKGTDPAQKAADKVTKGDKKQGLSDTKEKKLSDQDKKKELEEVLRLDGIEVNEEDKEIILNSWLNDSKYIFNTAEISGSRYIFDVSQPGGKIKVTFNSKHPAYDEFFKKIEEEDDHAYDTLKLLFAAWARMEDVSSAENIERKEMLEEIRFEWGNIAKNMIDEYRK